MKEGPEGAPAERARISAREFDALLLDLDGVITRTAGLHAAAWKRMFDEYLRLRAARDGEPFRPLEIEADYRGAIDGRPRYDGVRSFLDTRGIAIPFGTPDDGPEQETVCGLGNKKDVYFHQLLRTDGVEIFDSSVTLIRAAKARGFKVAVVSSSKNCAEVLQSAGLTDLFDAHVDGIETARLGLAGKPAPDMFLEAARRLGVERRRAAVFEDAVSGIEAARAGEFGLVVGVDRGRQAQALAEAGADVVVSDLREVILEGRRTATGPSGRSVPSALEHFGEIASRLRFGRPAVFLDYDGTLTPIVARPDLAVLSNEMRDLVARLARLCPVAIVSGRDRVDVEALVGVDGLVYAGSHGFDISGPNGLVMQHGRAQECTPALRRAGEEIHGRAGAIRGVLIEPKKFALAVHYRLVRPREVRLVRHIVTEVAARHPGLRVTGGKKVIELRPRLDWDKGKAVLWLRETLRLDGPDVVALYLGDDKTDEDAFAALKARDIGILVTERRRGTRARYTLANPEQVGEFLRKVIGEM